jgi:tetratricopeptide (TPR) repeat protein
VDLPDELQNVLWQRVIRAAKRMAREQGWNNVAEAIDRWTTDPTLQDSFLIAVKRGRVRLLYERSNTPSAITNIISAKDELFDSPEVLGPIFVLITHPGGHYPEVREKLLATFEQSDSDHVDTAVWGEAVDALLSCIAKELLSLPGTSELRDQYSLQLQHVSAMSLRRIADIAQQQKEQLEIVSRCLDSSRTRNMLAAPDSTMRRKPFHNVPRPDYTRLVGREDQLSRLRKLLRSDDRVFQIALVGVGGVGKSALAQAIALEMIERYGSMEEKDRFDCIIWASAKEEVLTLYGREPAMASGMGVHTLEHVFSRIAAVLEKESITTAPPAQQADVVRAVLQSLRCLLIIDNFESVTDNRIKPFLRELPAPSKVIITSREGFDVADVLRLYGLAPDAAKELANDEAQRHGLTLTMEQHNQLLSVTHGIPLAIRLGVARYAAGEVFEAVIRWLGDADGDITDYCITGQVQLAWSRDPNARSILLACSLFSMDVGASPEALGYVADISRYGRDRAITVLLRLQLFQVEHPGRYRMLPITQRFARTQFLAPDTKDHDLIERWLSWNLKVIDQVTGGELDTGGDRILGLEYSNVVNAARWCFETKRWTDLYTLASGLWSYAYTHSLFIDRTQSPNAVAEFDELLSMAMAAGRALGDDKKVGRVELQRARLQLIQFGPQSEGLMQLLDSAVEKAIASGNCPDILLALYTKGHVLFRRGELDAAQDIADDLMARARATGDDQFAFWAHYRTSEIQTAREQFIDALTSLQVAERHANSLHSARLHAHVLHRRSAALIAQGNGQDAVPVLLEALELDRRRGELRYVANDMFNLATIYAGIPSRKKEAVELAQDVHAIYTRLGMMEELGKAGKLLREMQA